jgi:hypothetical protein
MLYKNFDVVNELTLIFHCPTSIDHSIKDSNIVHYTESLEFFTLW